MSESVPFFRPRRLRGHPAIRDAISETHVRADNLMLPVFVADIEADREITAMPGVMQRNIDSLSRELESLVKAGLRSFILFGVPDHKDARATGATAEDGIVPRALRALKERLGDSALLATDVCACSYTDHGHCGIVEGGHVDNDASIELLAEIALGYAEAGADVIAPSDMMDGRVRRIRDVLDANGRTDLPIMSYAVKYASNLYGPFRHAADSAPQFGDRRGYQMDFRNRRDAIREALLDAEEGADILMVKPGVAYLDVIRDLREATELPLAAYQVSGEYSMVRYAAEAGALDERSVVHELWTSLRRAGADIILSYHAADAVRGEWLD